MDTIDSWSGELARMNEGEAGKSKILLRFPRYKGLHASVVAILNTSSFLSQSSIAS